jgi:hypothetical protein
VIGPHRAVAQNQGVQTASRAADDEGRQVVIHAHGHPEVRASHAKTLEITGEATITGRATCVIGVDGDLDPATIGLLRGPVRLTVAAAGLEATGHGVINPDHRVGDRLVVRRSDRADPDTLVLGSTLTAAHLAPAMVTALADPATAVTLTVSETGERRPLVLVGGRGEPVAGGRLGLLWRHADAMVDLGRRGTGAPSALDHGGTVAAILPDTSDPGAQQWLAAAARRGARFAVMPGASALPAGLAPSPATEALLAAGLPPAPVLWLGRVGRRATRGPEITGFLRSPPPVPVVLTVPAGDADAVLGIVAPEHPVAIQRDPLDVGTAVEWTTAADAVAAVAAAPERDVTIVVAPGSADGERVDLDRVVRALAAAGIAPRTLSEALAPLGLNRRRAYQALSERQSTSEPGERQSTSEPGERQSTSEPVREANSRR